MTNTHNKRKGYTLMEMLIVVAIIAILVAVMIPTLSGALEKSREAADLAGIRNAYAEIMMAVLLDEDATTSITVPLSQTRNDWQTASAESSLNALGTVSGKPAKGGTAVVAWEDQVLTITFDGNEESHTEDPTPAYTVMGGTMMDIADTLRNIIVELPDDYVQSLRNMAGGFNTHRGDGAFLNEINLGDSVFMNKTIVWKNNKPITWADILEENHIQLKGTDNLQGRKVAYAFFDADYNTVAVSYFVNDNETGPFRFEYTDGTIIEFSGRPGDRQLPAYDKEYALSHGGRYVEN